MSVSPQLFAKLDLDQIVIEGGKTTERRLSDLAECFADQESYKQALAAEDSLVYRVSSIEPGNGAGDLHYGLGMLMPGRIGEEFYLTKGHLHENRGAAEVYVGLSGQGAMLLEDERTGAAQLVPLTANSVVYVPGYTAHRTVNTGKTPLVYLGIYPANAGHDYASIAKRGFQHTVVATPKGPQMRRCNQAKT